MIALKQVMEIIMHFVITQAPTAIDSITQNNFVDASSSIGAGFVESNTVNTLQGFDLTNTCDESGDGESTADLY